MKNTRTLLALIATLALGSTAFAGTSPKQADDAAAPSTDVPVVTKVVNPSDLPLTFSRKVLEVQFSLDQNGQPQDVRIVSPTNSDVKKQVVKAFKEWRFDLAAVGPDVGAKRYVLPLDIIPEV